MKKVLLSMMLVFALGSVSATAQEKKENACPAAKICTEKGSCTQNKNKEDKKQSATPATAKDKKSDKTKPAGSCCSSKKEAKPAAECTPAKKCTEKKSECTSQNAEKKPCCSTKDKK